MRQNAMSSFRASATIIFVLRAAAGPSVRARYHWASALSFWNRRKRQASWIKPRLTRALPDFANPLSRRREPLSFGAPVRPAKRATARRSRRLTAIFDRSRAVVTLWLRNPRVVPVILGLGARIY